MKHNFKAGKGKSYNGSNIEQAIDSITDDNFDFIGDYELTLEIRRRFEGSKNE